MSGRETAIRFGLRAVVGIDMRDHFAHQGAAPARPVRLAICIDVMPPFAITAEIDANKVDLALVGLCAASR